MTSWRDNVSVEAQTDLDQLIGASFQLAEELMMKNGEMYPFGAAITRAGDFEYVAPSIPEAGEQPSSATILRACDEVVRTRLATLRAVAIVCDVRTPRGEALQVTVEHAEVVARRVLLPYGRDATGAVKEFGELEASLHPCRFWSLSS